MRVGVGWIVGVVLAAMWAGGLRAAIWWRDRQSAHWTEDTSADDAKRARLAELCARIPRLAPPASVVGADDVERLTGREVIALLRAGRLAELESLLESAQNVVESDSSKEHVVQNLASGFRFAAEELRRLDAWASASPRSFVPLLARAVTRIWRMNDPTSCDPTSRAADLKLAREDLERALSLRPGLSVAYEELLRIEGLEPTADARLIVERAVRTCRACVGPRTQYVMSLKSAGADARAAMRSFALEAQVHTADNPRVRSLLGLPYHDECASLEKAKRFTEALAACNRAIVEYPEAEFFATKAGVLERMDREQEAVEAASEALRYNPADLSLLLRRAHAHMTLENWQEAGSDVTAALQLAPRNDPAARVLLRLIDRLQSEAQRHLGSGELREAIRHYDLAIAIVPGEPSLLARRAALRARAGLATEDGSS